MKIFILLNALGYGGAEMQAVMDANALADIGHNVTVAYNGDGSLAALLSRKIRHYKIRYKNVLFASVQLLVHLFEYRYDIVHSHMFWAEKVSALPCFLTRHKLVFNEHGLGLWRKRFHILTMRIISLFANRIIASCEATRHVRVSREHLSKGKVVTIYNSFDASNRNKQDVRACSQSQNDRRFTIGFIGRFNKVKRLYMLINIAEQLKGVISNFRVVLVGDGGEKYVLENEIARRNLMEHFHLPGFVLDTGHYYQKFDIFVLPSEIEGFSIALLEAGAFGIPSIAFDVGGNPEIIRDGKTGFIIPEGNMEEFVQRIIYLHEHEKERAEMGKAARLFINSNFSLSRRINGLIYIYNSTK